MGIEWVLHACLCSVVWCGYRMGVACMFMQCGVVWDIGWVLHVYVL